MITGIVAHIEKYSEFDLSFDHMEASALRVQVYSDSSLASNHDQTLQLGYIGFLVDNSKSCHPLYWS